MTVLLMFLLSVSVLSGCGNSSAEKESNEKSSDNGIKTYVVAHSGSPKPFNYFDENNERAGYEIELLKEVEKRLGNVHFKFETTEFPSLFAGLDAGKFDLIINNITDKPERREKYLFSSEDYFKNHTVLAMKEETVGINTIDDLQGKTVTASPGSATANFLEAYNEKNKSNPINVDYVEGDYTPNILNVYNGRYMACIYSESYLDVVEKEYGFHLKRVNIANENEIQSPSAYILYRKDETELQQKIDKVIKEMKADGSLSELCIKYFDKDHTK